MIKISKIIVSSIMLILLLAGLLVAINACNAAAWQAVAEGMSQGSSSTTSSSTSSSSSNNNCAHSGCSIYNNTGYNFRRMYISPSSSSSWGSPLGGMSTGSSTIFYPRQADYDECNFDIKAVDVDEDCYYKFYVNFCSTSSTTITFDQYDHNCSRG